MVRKSLVVLFAVLFCAAPAMAANDPYWDQQWGLHKIQAEPAWGAGTGGGITIAIIDTGVDYNHPDLRGKTVGGYDFVSNDSDAKDEVAGPNGNCPGNPGHGTHVAGIAGATTNNGVGVAGTAPGASIMPVRVLNQHGCGYVSDVNEGIRYAVSRGAQVINLSLGGDVVFQLVPGEDFNFKEALNYAWASGVVPVVAAGNARLPSAYGDVNALIVGATNPQDGKPSWSSIPADSKWPIAAPGEGIWSSTPGGFGKFSGTSMSAPHVAGAAAVLRGLGLNPQQTVDRIRSTADAVPDPTVGARRLNLGKAVQGLGGGGGSTGGGTGSSGSGSGTSGGGTARRGTSSNGSPARPSGQAPTTVPPATTAVTQGGEASPSPGSVLSNDSPKKERPSAINIALVVLVIAAGLGFVLWYGRQAFSSR